jgi:amidohydrolase
MTKEEMKQKVCNVIEKNSDWVREIGEWILGHPELGFKEHQTSDFVQSKFKEMGLEPTGGIAITGTVASINGKQGGVRLAVMGEMDAVIAPNHPHADPVTGAAHACGHNASIAGMLGAGMGLIQSGVMEELSGEVVLMGVPAEELVEIEYRMKLRGEGKLHFLAGKQEFIRLGQLQNVDIAMIFHMDSGEGDEKVTVGGTHNGCLAKFIRYRGKEAHAGGSPHLGINALNAALIGLTGIHAQRETFQDEDNIRVHPIITKGGDLVNVVPADVRMETFVRGKRIEAILDANGKVNAALRAGAMALGAEVEITEVPGYLPRDSFAPLDRLFGDNAEQLVGKGSVGESGHRCGSTDMGDVAHLMPALHPYFKAGKGKLHSEEFSITDPHLAYVDSAKGLAMTAIDLMAEGAKGGIEIVKGFSPPLTQATFLETWEKLCQSRRE